MENLREKIKANRNLPCTKDWCRTMYEISQYCDDNPEKRRALDTFIKKGLCAYDSANPEQRKIVFDDCGPTPQECIDLNCFLPSILKEFGNGEELSEYLIAQKAKVDDFKWNQGIPDEKTAWDVWLSEKGEDGMTHAARFSVEYTKKHPDKPSRI